MAQKLLLIEDDHTMLTLLSTLLRYEGFEVSAITDDQSVEKIVQGIQQAGPDVVLMDVNLRLVNGLDVLQSIRQSMGATPRIVMYSGSDYNQRCLAMGADGFLMKPYMPETLIKKIREALTVT